MSVFTGVEFGPASCTLVRGRRVDGGLELSGAHLVEPSEWPSQADAAAELLKRIRNEKNFPPLARVVAWGLAEGASPRDIATRAALRPLIAAGFRIRGVMSPPQALAILAASRPRARAGASVWLAINRHGAAIAIVHGAALLYSRSFGWNWDAAAVGSQAQLLQRYSLVAHLAPEVRRGVDLVKSQHEVPIEHAVTCGDLPDLRSLTMPLIEELDLEVETLDSADGLVISPTARREHLPDSLASVRLACAAAAGPIVTGREIDVVRVARAAAVVAAVGSLGWIGYIWLTHPAPAASVVEGPAPSGVESSSGVEGPAPSGVQKSAGVEGSAPSAVGSSSGVEGPVPSGVERPPRTQAVPPAAGSEPSRVPPAGPASARTRNTGAHDTSGKSRQPPRLPPASRPERARGAQATPPLPDTGVRSSTQPPASASRPASTPDASPPPQTDVAGSRPRPAPLKDPLPAIDTILVSSDRRLAAIDGAFVGVGETIGQRTVVRIEVDAVFFREPSGLEIRVPIRMRR